jgi:hypothetical protein
MSSFAARKKTSSQKIGFPMRLNRCLKKLSRSDLSAIRINKNLEITPNFQDNGFRKPFQAVWSDLYLREITPNLQDNRIAMRFQAD